MSTEQDPLGRIIRPIIRGGIKSFVHDHSEKLEGKWIHSVEKRIVNQALSQHSRQKLIKVCLAQCSITTLVIVIWNKILFKIHNYFMLLFSRLILGLGAVTLVHSSQSEAPRYRGRGLKGDWSAVGNDLRSAMRRANGEEE